VAKRPAVKPRTVVKGLSVDREILAILEEIATTLKGIYDKLDEVIEMRPKDPDTVNMESKLDAILRELQAQRRGAS
jgi:hypothetical protein